MTELSDAMRRLTDTWTMRVSVGDGDRDQHFPPLVDMLRSRIVPDGNQTGGGSAVNTRNVLDVKSLDLLTHIQDVARAWLQEWRIVATGELKTDLRSYWGHLNTLHNTDAMDDVTFEHLAAYPDTWAVNIWDLIEPPIRVSVRGLPCPAAASGRSSTRTGTRRTT
ncbi:hypothetical protein FVO59_11890 [Microbacterium esteraromaticum]|uniref:Uncharacterized protein n=1 Tax=Microbacterium esteraromaticum TaxID=57043 RepID=A0A7D8AKM2_9MICO|nr:hypothetical protein [Microbacterium esteraromaticum]QMU97829.1 hypothetical protein FVO59_11890 [Microbacterium esteraromaticum]